MGAVRRYGHLLAGIAVVLVGCSDPDTTTTAATTPSATPHTTSEQPEATATPVHPTAASTPTPAEVPSGPDDPGWAEHLGLTEEELERRRASDDFLEWAEPRRARESPGADRTLRRMAWAPPDRPDRRVRFMNPEALWPEIGPIFRDRLLAQGSPPRTAPRGYERTSGYVYTSERDAPSDLQQYLLVGFAERSDGSVVALIQQHLLRVSVRDLETYQATGRLEHSRLQPRVVDVEEPLDEIFAQQLKPEFEDWFSEYGHDSG